ncbi:MAG: PTS sugar transporter subunit IIA [Acetivibrionales bacterium]|jgi:PTS system glucose-specific IIA component
MFGLNKKNNTIVDLMAPISGKIIDITEVPDQVFSKKMVGDGIAIEPTNGLVVSPCNGTVVLVFGTNHALGIQTREGIEILIHMGIDTVELKGKGFKRLTETGMEVKTGDVLMEMDLDKIKSMGKLTVTPVIITNPNMAEAIEKNFGMAEAIKDKIMEIKLKK